MSIQSRITALGEIEDTDERLAAGEQVRTLLTARDTGRLIECLDDGFVRLVDHMGDDAAVVQAARVSYGTGTKAVSDDRGLIRYLMRHFHTTPFEMIEFKFHVRVPMDCWRQWIRHRSASVNEMSTRYSEAIDSRSSTNQDKWRLQSKDKKQGSDGFVPEYLAMSVDPVAYYEFTGEYLSKREKELHELSRRVYLERLGAGVSREQARKDLPLSTYTEAFWKIDGHNLLHFLALRMDAHAQAEIRTYANAIADLIKRLIPLTWEAFEDYRLNSISLSYSEQREIYRIVRCEKIDDVKSISIGERKEFAEKLKRLGIEINRLCQQT